MKNKIKKPTEATIAVTYNCNARCVMCNIWQTESKNHLQPSDFANLPDTLKDINITGGEPFLRNDLREIIQVITTSCPKARIVISSNGFLTDRIVKFMHDIKSINPRTGIAISLDGIGEMHSEIRGIENAYKSVIKTITYLKESGIKDIRFGFTASKQNIEHLHRVYDLARVFDIEFTMSAVHNSDSYFSIETNVPPPIDKFKEEVKYVFEHEYKNLDPRRLFRTFYIKGIIELLEKKKRPLECFALDKFFFLGPDGSVHPCNMMDKPIGNITEKSFDEIWFDREINGLRDFCKNCNDCWMVCTAKSSLREHPIKVSKSILKDMVASGKS